MPNTPGMLWLLIVRFLIARKLEDAISTVLQHADPRMTAGEPDAGPAIVIHALAEPFRPLIWSRL
jgi:hypothetical protein